MGIIERLKKDRKLLLVGIGLIISIFLIPYVTIPVVILWWFYKKSKLSKRTKTLVTSVIGGIFAVSIIWFGISYAKDVEPHLNIAEPASNVKVLGQQVTIKGNYDPIDRKVWVNGK